MKTIAEWREFWKQEAIAQRTILTEHPDITAIKFQELNLSKNSLKYLDPFGVNHPTFNMKSGDF